MTLALSSEAKSTTSFDRIEVAWNAHLQRGWICEKLPFYFHFYTVPDAAPIRINNQMYTLAYLNFNSLALIATITVLKLISTAPIAGLSMK